MCRNIKTLHNFKPAATEEEIRASVIRGGVPIHRDLPQATVCHGYAIGPGTVCYFGSHQAAARRNNRRRFVMRVYFAPSELN